MYKNGISNKQDRNDTTLLLMLFSVTYAILQDVLFSVHVQASVVLKIPEIVFSNPSGSQHSSGSSGYTSQRTSSGT